MDARGNRVADYLSGYDIRTIDLTSIGGPSHAVWAGHQVLRIAAGGTVDTLVNGWSQWAPSDYADAFSAYDLDHPNAITFDRDGQPMISYRNEDAIIKVDSMTHAVIWQLGGKRNQFTFVNDPLGGFSGQHSIRVLPNGHLLMLDNGTNHSPKLSRIVEYTLDARARTATLVWQYTPSPPIFNTFTGSAQRLANGNTIAGWTNFGLVDEVSPTGVVLSRMQIWSAPGTPAISIYRSIRINNLYRYMDP
ncbi:MAG: aryl-sulfate sulfotransferase [Gemmatimonadota bacterium]|nr:aryl-sulfate sulfotransferase [Gemmatimonadota bacterium]